jgi:hypothetical protein
MAGSAGATNVAGGGSSSGSAGAPSSDAGDGATAAGAAAGGEAGAGPCVPETLAEFCERIGKDCGTVDGSDNCGTAITGAECGTCSGFARCGGAAVDNVCGALTDPALGGMATASSVMSINEGGPRAFDLDITTKWYSGDSNDTGWLVYQFADNTEYVVKSYSITSGNDFPSRDPAAWELQGSYNGATWMTIDQRTSQVFAMRRQTNSYTTNNTFAYRWYRLLVTANAGSTSLQLAELVLYAN